MGPVPFLRLAALRIAQTKAVVSATSGVGLATNPSAAVCVRRAGHHTDEAAGPCLGSIVGQTDLQEKVDCAIETVEQVIEGVSSKSRAETTISLFFFSLAG